MYLQVFWHTLRACTCVSSVCLMFQSNDLVSVVAVGGASASMLFKVEVASTHTFLQILHLHTLKMKE